MLNEGGGGGNVVHKVTQLDPLFLQPSKTKILYIANCL